MNDRSQLPVVGANGIQNILDTILPLHSLLGFVNHRWQVLQMGFKRKKSTRLSSPFRLTFRNAKPIWKGYLLRSTFISKQERRSTEVDSFLIITAAWEQSINVFSSRMLLAYIHANSSRTLLYGLPVRFSTVQQLKLMLALPRQTAKWLLVQMRKSKRRCW